jgi:hypothetical protein
MNDKYIEYIDQLLDIAERNDIFCLTSRAFTEFALEVMEALEKQKQRTPDSEITDTDGIQHTCPSCWGFVGYMHEHCEKCGQKLDWD